MKRNETDGRGTVLLRERMEKVAALLERAEARAWGFPLTSEFRARAESVRPLRDEIRRLIFGQPSFEHELRDTDANGRVTVQTVRQEAVEGIADELTDALAAMGILAGPRPRSDGFHSPLMEFVGDALGVRWLVECDTICRHCRALALREVHAVLARLGGTPAAAPASASDRLLERLRALKVPSEHLAAELVRALEGGPRPNRDLKEAVKRHADTVRKILNALAKAGLVRVVGAGAAATWELTEKGRALLADN
ncbi:MAG: hypothetical protein IT458_00015 [Planctomycetes bacterium]|nr:hypothetical protein [Planctomycetota bacterium]